MQLLIRESRRKRLEWRGNVALGLGGGLAVAGWLPAELLAVAVLACGAVFFFHARS